MKKLYVALVMALLLVAGSPAAKADIIPAWDYSIDGVFTHWQNDSGASWTYGNGLNGTGISVVGNPQTLSYDYLKALGSSQSMAQPGSQVGAERIRWGNNPYSGIAIGGSNGVAVTNGAAADGLTLTHYNQVINSGVRELSYGQALLALTLSPMGMPALAQTYATVFDFHFIETPNTGSYQNDIFFVENPLVQATEKIIINYIEYTFSFAASFTELTGQYATLARELMGWDSSKAVYGWTTRENMNTTFETNFIVTARQLPVPEPATMMLLGFGLSGLGVLARKRRQS